MSRRPIDLRTDPIPQVRRRPRPISGVPTYLVGRPNVMYLDRYGTQGRAPSRRR